MYPVLQYKQLSEKHHFSECSSNSNTLAGVYMFKASNGNTWTVCGIYSKLTMKTPERYRGWHRWRRSGVWIVIFGQISHIAVVFPLLTLNKKNAGWNRVLKIHLPKNPHFKQLVPKQALNQNFFRAGELFMELGDFDKHLLKTREKKGKGLEFFVLNTLKKHFKWKIEHKNEHYQGL